MWKFFSETTHLSGIGYPMPDDFSLFSCQLADQIGHEISLDMVKSM